MRPIIYVIAPLSAPDAFQRVLNIDDADRAAQQLMQRGYAPINTHKLMGHWNITEAEAMAVCLRLLSVSAAVCVLGGWESSSGCVREIEEAEELGLPTYYGIEEVPELLRIA